MITSLARLNCQKKLVWYSGLLRHRAAYRHGHTRRFTSELAVDAEPVNCRCAKVQKAHTRTHKEDSSPLSTHTKRDSDKADALTFCVFVIVGI